MATYLLLGRRVLTQACNALVQIRTKACLMKTHEHNTHTSGYYTPVDCCYGSFSSSNVLSSLERTRRNVRADLHAAMITTTEAAHRPSCATFAIKTLNKNKRLRLRENADAKRSVSEMS